jgi:hypothetical protein
MANGIVAVPPPRAPVFRVGRTPNPFAAPSWAFAHPDGTFGNRFDDPGGHRGVPATQRFRVLYLATESAGAFGETLASYRPDLAGLAGAGAPPPSHPSVPASWRLARRLGSAVLHPSLRLADLAAAESTHYLRGVLAPVALSLGLNDIDFSTLIGPQRLFTQEAARAIYDERDPSGQPLYAGLRYLSRLNPAWECWAVFVDRLQHTVIRVEVIPPNHPGLHDAARILGLAIEVAPGRYLYP